MAYYSFYRRMDNYYRRINNYGEIYISSLQTRIYVGYNKKKNDLSAVLKNGNQTTKIKLSKECRFDLDLMIYYLFAKDSGLSTNKRKSYRIDKKDCTHDDQIVFMYAKQQGLTKERLKELKQLIIFTGELEEFNEIVKSKTLSNADKDKKINREMISFLNKTKSDT